MKLNINKADHENFDKIGKINILKEEEINNVKRDIIRSIFVCLKQLYTEDRKNR